MGEYMEPWTNALEKLNPFRYGRCSRLRLRRVRWLRNGSTENCAAAVCKTFKCICSTHSTKTCAGSALYFHFSSQYFPFREYSAFLQTRQIPVTIGLLVSQYIPVCMNNLNYQNCVHTKKSFITQTYRMPKWDMWFTRTRILGEFIFLMEDQPLRRPRKYLRWQWHQLCVAVLEPPVFSSCSLTVVLTFTIRYILTFWDVRILFVGALGRPTQKMGMQ